MSSTVRLERRKPAEVGARPNRRPAHRRAILAPRNGGYRCVRRFDYLPRIDDNQVMKAKIAVALFIGGALLLFTPTLWNYFQNEKLRALVASAYPSALEIYTRFGARVDGHGQVALWATGIALVMAACLCVRRCRLA